MEDNKVISKSKNKIIAVGYIFSFLSFFVVPLQCMVVAIIMGIMCITKDEITHGVVILLLSITIGVVGMEWGVEMYGRLLENGIIDNLLDNTK